MESFKKNLQRIEQPLNFAAKDDFKNLSHIKDLGKSLSGLIAFQISAIPPSAKNIFGPALDNMMRIFLDYDLQDVAGKKIKITEASLILERLKNAADSFDARRPAQEEQITARIEDLKASVEKLSLPVQFLKGVGPKMAERFAAKKSGRLKICFIFCPGPMKIAGKSAKSTNWKRTKPRRLSPPSRRRSFDITAGEESWKSPSATIPAS